MNNNMAFVSPEDIEWIKEYISKSSPTGKEDSGQRAWMDRFMPFFDDHITTPYGCQAGIVNPGKDFKVVIEAHADEIAWYVNRIGADGLIHVTDTGGTDPGVAPSKKVHIHTSKGIVDGIFGWPAIHTRNVSDDAPKISTIFVDCGCTSAEEVMDLGIQIGDYITYTTDFFVLNKNYYVGRALDNRMGGFIIGKVAQLIKENNIELPYTLYVINAVQEETGTNGAKMMAEQLKPDCAFVIDVTHDTTTPTIDKNKEGEITAGDGPVITKSPPVHNKMREHLIQVANENDIPYQLAAMSKQTGTDADAFAFENGGIPTGLVSMALKYMHTTVETVHKNDVESCIGLLYHALQKMKPDFSFKYY